VPEAGRESVSEKGALAGIAYLATRTRYRPAPCQRRGTVQVVRRTQSAGLDLFDLGSCVYYTRLRRSRQGGTEVFSQVSCSATWLHGR